MLDHYHTGRLEPLKKRRSNLDSTMSSAPKKQRLLTAFLSKPSTSTEAVDDANQPHRDETQPSNEPTSPSRKKAVTIKREFNPKWLESNSWLRHEYGKMTCSVCVAAGKDNPFTIGCTNFRHSTIVRHISSNQHRTALEAQALKSTMSKQTMSLISSKNDAVLGAMRTVYWLAKENLPTIKYKSLLELHRLQGCSFPDDLKISSTALYTSHTTAEEMQDAISTVLSKKVDKCLMESPYVSILIDESCDISVTKKLLLYCRTVTSSFDVETHFISNVTIPDGKAKTIYESVKDTLASRGVSMSKVIVVGSDGASVMTGSKNGVVAMIKKSDSPFVFGVHCVAHRLALCSSQAAEDVPYLKIYQKVLSDLFYHFKRSALRREKLKEIQKILNDPILQYKELHSVRWFSMFSALQTIYRTWGSLATFMEEQMEQSNDSVAKGFFKKICTFVFIATTHLLMDIIPRLTQLSLFFQKENLDIAMLRPSIDSVVQKLEWLKHNDGTFLSEFMSQAGDKLSHFKDIKIVDTPVYRQQFNKTRKLFLDNLISQICKRFPAVSTSIVSSMSVLCLRGMSLMSEAERKAYGVQQLNTLIEHYTPTSCDKDDATASSPTPMFLNREETLVEWEMCKDLVYQQQYPCHTIQSTWKLLIENHPNSFPNLSKLSMVAVLAPLQTATVERGFSVQNDIKVASRNRLSASRLNVLMQISMGPPIETFDFQRALMGWKDIKKRKLYS